MSGSSMLPLSIGPFTVQLYIIMIDAGMLHEWLILRLITFQIVTFGKYRSIYIYNKYIEIFVSQPSLTFFIGMA